MQFTREYKPICYFWVTSYDNLIVVPWAGPILTIVWIVALKIVRIFSDSAGVAFDFSWVERDSK